MEKKSVKNNSELFISSSFDKEKLMTETTSGTEGKPLICYKSKNERLEYAYTLWTKRSSVSKCLKPSDKCVHFYAYRRLDDEFITDPILYKGNILYLSSFDLSHSKLELYWEKVQEFEPKWMMGPTSAIYNLARVVKENNLKKYSFKLIELTGEYVTDENMDFIKEVFNCGVTNHYGAKEFWAIGYSNLNNKLQVLDTNVYVETIYNKNCDSNEIFVTALKNKSWPLIRYKIGDLGNLVNDYNCERDSFYLDLKRGREIECFTLANGKKIHAILFSSLCRIINEIEGIQLINQYQIIKVTETHLIIKLCIQDSDKREIKLLVILTKNCKKLLVVMQR